MRRLVSLLILLATVCSVSAAETNYFSIVCGKERLAVINRQEFAAGDQKIVKLRDQSAQVRCLQVQDGEITVEVDGQPLTVEQGAEKKLP